MAFSLWMGCDHHYRIYCSGYLLYGIKMRAEYDDEEYWSQKNPSNSNIYDKRIPYGIGPSHINLYNEIRKLDFKSIFEVGCGMGKNLRNLWIIFPDKKISGCDVNSFVTDTAVHYCLDAKINIFLSSAKKIKVNDNSFDLVFTNNFLQHVSPNNIKDVIKEIIRIASKFILHSEDCFYKHIDPSKTPMIDIDEDDPPSFNHDYEKLYSNIGKFKFLVDNRNSKLKCRETIMLIEK